MTEDAYRLPDIPWYGEDETIIGKEGFADFEKAWNGVCPRCEDFLGRHYQHN